MADKVPLSAFSVPPKRAPSWDEIVNPRYVGAYNLGGEITDKTGSPSLGALAYALSSGLDPNEQGAAYKLGQKVTDWTGSPTLAALAYSLTRPFEGGPGQAATVFHGSPHLFDKFKMEKIGTGEGAQAYGHGLYFAENPNVARGYRDALVDSPNVHRTASFDMNTGQWVRDQQGAVYKVDLPDEAIGKMLDWDKPLSQQPETIKTAINKILPKGYAADDFANGDALYKFLSRYDAVKGTKTSEAQLSSILKDAGIPGIKYLDQGSRAAGKGSYNYVVFDENLPKILGRE